MEKGQSAGDVYIREEVTNSDSRVEISENVDTLHEVWRFHIKVAQRGFDNKEGDRYPRNGVGGNIIMVD